MTKYKYKNISGRKQEVIGYGKVEADMILITDKPINNPNFELVFDKTEAKSKKVKK